MNFNNNSDDDSSQTDEFTRFIVPQSHSDMFGLLVGGFKMRLETEPEHKYIAMLDGLLHDEEGSIITSLDIDFGKYLAWREN